LGSTTHTFSSESRLEAATIWAEIGLGIGAGDGSPTGSGVRKGLLGENGSTAGSGVRSWGKNIEGEGSLGLARKHHSLASGRDEGSSQQRKEENAESDLDIGAEVMFRLS
jgi:hypothetical protein